MDMMLRFPHDRSVCNVGIDVINQKLKRGLRILKESSGVSVEDVLQFFRRLFVRNPELRSRILASIKELIKGDDEEVNLKEYIGTQPPTSNTISDMICDFRADYSLLLKCTTFIKNELLSPKKEEVVACYVGNGLVDEIVSVLNLRGENNEMRLGFVENLTVLANASQAALAQMLDADILKTIQRYIGQFIHNNNVDDRQYVVELSNLLYAILAKSTNDIAAARFEQLNLEHEIFKLLDVFKQDTTILGCFCMILSSMLGFSQYASKAMHDSLRIDNIIVQICREHQRDLKIVDYCLKSLEQLFSHGSNENGNDEKIIGDHLAFFEKELLEIVSFFKFSDAISLRFAQLVTTVDYTKLPTKTVHDYVNVLIYVCCLAPMPTSEEITKCSFPYFKTICTNDEVAKMLLSCAQSASNSASKAAKKAKKKVNLKKVLRTNKIGNDNNSFYLFDSCFQLCKDKNPEMVVYACMVLEALTAHFKNYEQFIVDKGMISFARSLLKLKLEDKKMVPTNDVLERFYDHLCGICLNLSSGSGDLLVKNDMAELIVDMFSRQLQLLVMGNSVNGMALYHAILTTGVDGMDKLNDQLFGLIESSDNEVMLKNVFNNVIFKNASLTTKLSNSAFVTMRKYETFDDEFVNVINAALYV